MDWIRTINNAIEYMEDHLTDKITLGDISKNVNLSVFHFQRAFSMLRKCPRRIICVKDVFHRPARN